MIYPFISRIRCTYPHRIFVLKCQRKFRPNPFPSIGLMMNTLATPLYPRREQLGLFEKKNPKSPNGAILIQPGAAPQEIQVMPTLSISLHLFV